MTLNISFWFSRKIVLLLCIDRFMSAFASDYAFDKVLYFNFTLNFSVFSYIYIPLGGNRTMMTRVIASVASFAYVFVYHGMTINVCKYMYFVENIHFQHDIAFLCTLNHRN